jgi:hypothetical protein
VWTPANWGGSFYRSGDTSATVSPRLLVGNDSPGAYQWTVSFIGNRGVSFSFQVHNEGSPSAPPTPPPAPQPPPFNPPTAPPSFPIGGTSQTTPPICHGPTIVQDIDAGLASVQNSSDVQDAIKVLALKIIAIRGGEETEVAADLVTDSISITKTWASFRSGDIAEGSLELTNFISFGLLDAILKRFRITLPVSDILNLAGAEAGSFITGFAISYASTKCP